MNALKSPATQGSLVLVPTLLALILLFLFAAAGCAPRTLRPSEVPPLALTFLPDPGDYISPQGERLDPDQMAALAGQYDYVLIGEMHNNQCDHNIQQQVVAVLAQGPRPPAVGLEMVALDKNPVLQGFLDGDIPLENLEERLDWGQRWGYPFALFRPLFAKALEHGLPLAGLNLPQEVLSKARKQGVEALTREERALYPGRVIPPDPEQSAMLEAAYNMHEGLSGHLTEFFHTQAVWDSMMAEQAVALRQRTGRPVVAIAGSGHVEHGWGIALRLAVLDPGARILLLDSFRGGEFPGPEDTARADAAFFFCPQHLDSKLGMSLEIRQGQAQVVRVQRGSRADRAGLRPGDRILRVQGREMWSFMDLHDAGKEAHDKKQPLVMTVERHTDQERQTIDIDFGKLGQVPSEEHP